MRPWTVFFLIGCSAAPTEEPTATEELPTAPLTEDASVEGITEAHNEVRRPLGVPDLAYDVELADVAAAWAVHLDEDEACSLVHDWDSPYGENLFWSSGRATVQDAVDGWADEVAFYDYESNTCEEGQMCGHYTQLVWSTTERVGCAVHSCSGNRGDILMCVYEPAGNWVGQRPY